MKHEVLERYLGSMPEEAVDSMLELANEQRWAILLALIAKKRMYFNEIKEEFGAAPAQVDTALKHLVAGGFVARRVGDLGEIGDKGKTFYTPTPLAYAVVKAVTDAFLPPEPVLSAPEAPSFAVAGGRAFPRSFDGIGMPTVVGTIATPKSSARNGWSLRRTRQRDRVRANV